MLGSPMQRLQDLTVLHGLWWNGDRLVVPNMSSIRKICYGSTTVANSLAK